MSTRFKADPQNNEVLDASTLLDDDKFQCRHSFNTSDDSDKGVSKGVLQSSPVAVCSTSAGTVNKIATIDNFPDFKLYSGREVVCYFENGNDASAPKFNLNGTGAYTLELENQASSVTIGKGCWGAGVWLHLKFVDITVNGNRIQKWIICGHNIAQQDTSASSGYTIYSDGKIKQWGYKTLSNISIRNSSTYGYVSDVIEINFPLKMENINDVNIEITKNSNALWLLKVIDFPTVNIYLARATSLVVSNCKIFISVEGYV